jgi:hypothetical protein
MTTLLCREDWTDFRNLEGVGRKAGVPLEDIPRLVAKELVDNSLDVGAWCDFYQDDDGTIHVEDDGPGLGTPEEVARLFSVGRDRLSSKLIRLPTRGALGNGLRVVTGAVLASGGTLTVRTSSNCIRLKPLDDGPTSILSTEPWGGQGTDVEIKLGPAIPEDDDVFAWARWAKLLANRGASYKGRSSPLWYDSDHWWELFQSAGAMTVRELISILEGCGRANAGKIAAGYLNRAGADLSRDEAEAVLWEARNLVGEFNPLRLGYVGPLDEYPGRGVVARGTFEVAPGVGSIDATIPFVVEAWARVEEEPEVVVCVNRTIITDEVYLRRQAKNRTHYNLFGCNLCCSFKAAANREFSLLVNVLCPYLPKTTDGKAPDLAPLHKEIRKALESAVNRAKKAANQEVRQYTKKAVVADALPDAIARISGNGNTRYSLRQLFYAIRPRLLKVFGKEPKYGTFTKIISAYEEELGHDLEGIYRDNRGTLYHPHLRQEIPLGTLAVEEYQRPEWTFNKVLYCEKEGFFPLLKDARWPERHDCALLTSKGYATKAARDVLNLLGETAENLQFFCTHDADGPGTWIQAKLEQGTKQKVNNLGLEPDEALEMGLEPEKVTRKSNKAVAVAPYVSQHSRVWLQTNRIELNAMTTPQFLAWLDGKMEEHQGKVTPPQEVLVKRLKDEVKTRVHKAIVAAVLAEADVDGQTERACRELQPALKTHGHKLYELVLSALKEDPEEWWVDEICRQADEVADQRRRK